MAWQLLAAALPAAAKVAGTYLQKPSREDYKPQTDYMKKYLGYLRGRSAGKEVMRRSPTQISSMCSRWVKMRQALALLSVLNLCGVKRPMAREPDCTPRNWPSSIRLRDLVRSVAW